MERTLYFSEVQIYLHTNLHKGQIDDKMLYNGVLQKAAHYFGTSAIAIFLLCSLYLHGPSDKRVHQVPIVRRAREGYMSQILPLQLCSQCTRKIYDIIWSLAGEQDLTSIHLYFTPCPASRPLLSHRHRTLLPFFPLPPHPPLQPSPQPQLEATIWN